MNVERACEHVHYGETGTGDGAIITSKREMITNRKDHNKTQLEEIKWTDPLA